MFMGLTWIWGQYWTYSSGPTPNSYSIYEHAAPIGEVVLLCDHAHGTVCFSPDRQARAEVLPYRQASALQIRSRHR